MISRIDLYVLKKFLFVFLLVLASILMIFIVIDFVENVNKFLESPNYSLGLISRYYLYYVPHIIYLVMPVIVLIASLFSIMSMSRYNELVALQSSGVSLYRIILPLIILGIFLSIGMIGFGEFVVPEANQNRLEMLEYEMRSGNKKISQRVSRKFFQDSEGKKIYVSEYDFFRNKGKNIFIQEFDGSRMIKRLDAQYFLWDDPDWKLINVSFRDFRTTPYTYKKIDTMTVSFSGINPTELLKEKRKPEEMNYFELNVFIEQLKRMGTKTTFWEVARNSKISYPFANLIIIVFGALLAANKRRSGPALGFMIALTIIFAYYFIFKFAEIFGQNGEIPPLLASWVANIVFGVAGVIALSKVRQ